MTRGVGFLKLALLALALAACTADAPPPAAPAAAEAPRFPPKPSAPVEVTLDAVPLGGGDYQLTLTATPTRPVTQLVLTLDGQQVTVGATLAGQPRTTTARVHVDAGAGREFAGGAAVGAGNHRRTRGAVVQVGSVAAKAAPPTRILTLPDGSQISEVRQ